MCLYNIKMKLQSTGQESIPEFATRVLKDRTLSDEQIIDIYFRTKFFWKASAIAKKWESIRKILSYMKNKGKIEEVRRVTREVSAEIFYRLIKE